VRKKRKKKEKKITLRELHGGEKTEIYLTIDKKK